MENWKEHNNSGGLYYFTNTNEQITQKNEQALALKDALDQLDLIDIYRLLHP